MTKQFGSNRALRSKICFPLNFPLHTANTDQTEGAEGHVGGQNEQ